MTDTALAARASALHTKLVREKGSSKRGYSMARWRVQLRGGLGRRPPVSLPKIKK